MVTITEKKKLLKKMTDAIMEIGKGDPTKALKLLLESIEIIADALAERDDKRRAANSETRSLPGRTSTTIKSPGYYYGGGGCTRGTLKPQSQGA